MSERVMKERGQKSLHDEEETVTAWSLKGWEGSNHLMSLSGNRSVPNCTDTGILLDLACSGRIGDKSSICCKGIPAGYAFDPGSAAGSSLFEAKEHGLDAAVALGGDLLGMVLNGGGIWSPHRLRSYSINFPLALAV